MTIFCPQDQIIADKDIYNDCSFKINSITIIFYSVLLISWILLDLDNNILNLMALKIGAFLLASANFISASLIH